MDKYLMSDKLNFIFFSLITKILYDLSVIYILPETYMFGLTYGVCFSAEKAVVGWIVYLLMISVFCKKNLNNYGNLNICIYILWFTYYTPLNSAYALNDLNIGFLLLSSVFWLVLVVISETKFTIGDKKLYNDETQISNIDIVFNSTIASILFIILDVFCIIYVFQYNGFNLSLNLINIYDARASYVGTTTIFESILFNFGGNVIIPISMIYGFNNKKFHLFVIGLFAQLGIFSVAMQKGNLLIILVVILVIILKKFCLLEKVKRLITIAVPGLIISCFIEKYLIGSNVLFMLFVRRILYIPAWLNGLYYRFFCENKLLLFSQDVFLVERLGLNRYDSSVLKLINNKFFSGYMPSPNTGMFAEGFMHLGMAGAFVFPVIWIAFLKWIFKSTLYYEKNIQVFFIIHMALSVTNLPCTSGIFCVTYLFFIPFTFIISHFALKKNN